MPAELYAALLLVFRVVSVTLIVDVIIKQRELKKRPIADTKAAVLREDMYKLTIVALAMNFIPIIVDVLTIVGIGSRPDIIPWPSVIYMFSYSFGTLALTSIIYRMYRKSLEY